MNLSAAAPGSRTRSADRGTLGKRRRERAARARGHSPLSSSPWYDPISALMSISSKLGVSQFMISAFLVEKTNASLEL